MHLGQLGCSLRLQHLDVLTVDPDEQGRPTVSDLLIA